MVQLDTISTIYVYIRFVLRFLRHVPPRSARTPPGGVAIPTGRKSLASTGATSIQSSAQMLDFDMGRHGQTSKTDKITKQISQRVAIDFLGNHDINYIDNH